MHSSIARKCAQSHGVGLTHPLLVAVAGTTHTPDPKHHPPAHVLTDPVQPQTLSAPWGVHAAGRGDLGTGPCSQAGQEAHTHMQSTHSHQVTETREGHHTARLPSQSKLLLTCRGRVGALARVGSRSGASQCCGPACLCCGCGHGLAGCGCWTYGGTWGEGTATQETCSLQSLHAADVAAGRGRW